MEASDIKRLKKLEHENDRLKRMYGDLSLENAALKEVIAKKTLRPADRREVVTYLVMVSRPSGSADLSSSGTGAGHVLSSPHGLGQE